MHSRARFTQARSELGLSQDTPVTPEPVSALAFGLDRHQREKLDNVTPFIPQIDLGLAKSQKAAAEGMEKVSWPDWLFSRLLPKFLTPQLPGSLFHA